MVSSSLQIGLPLKTFEEILKEVFTVLDEVSCTNTIENLIMGIFNFTKKYPDRETSLVSKDRCFELVQIKLQRFIDELNDIKVTSASLFCIIKLLTACFSSIDIGRENNDVQVLIRTFSINRYLLGEVFHKDHDSL